MSSHFVNRFQSCSYNSVDCRSNSIKVLNRFNYKCQALNDLSIAEIDKRRTLFSWEQILQLMMSLWWFEDYKCDNLKWDEETETWLSWEWTLSLMMSSWWFEDYKYSILKWDRDKRETQFSWEWTLLLMMSSWWFEDYKCSILEWDSKYLSVFFSASQIDFNLVFSV